MKRHLSIAALGFFCCMLAMFSLNAQTTGSFNRTITFDGQPRTLSLYVPPSYNAANPARLMVCLHGAGDNSTNYRNALINSLAMQNTFTNTIFVCPDGGADQAKDFYTPAGDEFIIDSSIAYVADSYAVDQSYMILQGFSLGGRSSLRYGLTYPGMFKGLLLNTPAIQGCKEAVLPGGYAYQNAAGIPIYISHGATDELYTNPIDSAMLMLVMNDANVKLNRLAGVGHTIPPMAQMPELDTFFDAQTVVDYDIDLFTVRTPIRSCQAAYDITALFRNTGIQSVTSVDFEYTINGNADTITWTGNLASFEHAMLTIPSTASVTNSNITMTVLNVNGSMPDAVAANNTQQATFEYVTTPASLTYTEDFESVSIPAGWIHETAGDIIAAWTPDDLVAFNSNASMFAFNTIFVFDNLGRSENLYTPVLDLSGTTNPELTFDLTYNYHRYTPPYFLDTVNFADTLEIAASSDCGETWQVLYRKGGADLTTFATPIINPLSLQAGYQTPTAADWRNEHVALAPVAGNGEVVIRLSYISGLGGWINIDNVNVTATTGVNDAVKTASLDVFPNPAHERVTVQCTETILSVSVTDMQGRVVTTTQPAANAQDVQLSTDAWTPGVYMVQVRTENGSAVKKLVVE